jgi:putative acetyltransferase
MTTIRPAITEDDIAAVRQLCWDYRAELMNVSEIDAQITRTFYPVPKYTALMDGLTAAHARPTGVILLALLNGVPAGCVMSHPLDARSAEVKRLFVSPHARGHGIARALMEAVMSQAQTDGFARILLDTSTSLTAARALYLGMGFTPRGPYQDIPAEVLPHLLFFEKSLQS